MILYDISVPLSEGLPAYPGDPPVEITPLTGTEEKGAFQISRLAFGSHAGTHIDAPAHLLPQGATTDEIPLHTLLGPCLVVDISHHEGHIDAGVLKKLHLKGHQRILFRTGNSALWNLKNFVENYDALTAEAADYLVKIGVKLVGIDYLSVDSFQSTDEVHRLLLEAGIVILEGINLSSIERGEYELICLPLKIEGIDGAPCRAILRGPEKTAPAPAHHTRWPL